VATVDLQAELELPAGAFPPRPGQDEVAVRIEPLAPGDIEAPASSRRRTSGRWGPSRWA